VPAMVDPRQPRFGQAVTGTVLALAFMLGWSLALPVLALILGAASLLGPRANLYAYLWRGLVKWLRLGPPGELEEAAPPRFANTVGFAFLTVASVTYAFGSDILAWTLGLIVSGLALLAAVTGLCVGCELYVLARRVGTRGRVPAKRVARGPTRVEAGT
jgi:Domain of unknown function (DUF4395)